jgi:hypothetical protein
MARARWGLALALLVGAAPPVSAQAGLMVVVFEATSGAPVGAALVRALRAGRQERTDRAGQARFAVLDRPETLVVASVGFRPETLQVGVEERSVEVRLASRAFTLGELTVTGRERGLAPSASGRWEIPRAAIFSVPAGLEADPLRALSVVPSVAFSTPLSARPLIRGYSASESVIRIDGFEVLNPYHIGRIFSGFPADAVASMSVAPLPEEAAEGATLAGVVDIRGRAGGSLDGSRYGFQLSPISASGWVGTRGLFFASRVAHLSVATRLAAARPSPYVFQDGYARIRAGLGGGRSVETSLFFSRDRLGWRGQGSLGMDWSNVLLGQRWRVTGSSSWSLDLVGSFNRYALEGTKLPLKSVDTDINNRFTRTSFGLDATWRRGRTDFASGTALAARRMQSSTEPRYLNPPQSQDVSLSDAQAYLTARRILERATLEAGLRLDASRTARSLQPRARVSFLPRAGFTAALTYARASRLYQLLSDVQSEPEIAFVDSWLNSDDAAVPTPKVDHVAADIDLERGGRTLHVSLFASRGRGIGELSPITDQRPGVGPYRFGRSRTRGIELRGALRSTGGHSSLVANYVLSSSQRRWDDGVWSPWRLDRRHVARIQAETRLGGRWHVFAVGELLSGQPITRVQEVFRRPRPTIPGAPDVGRFLLNYVYAEEGAARSTGTYRFDLGVDVRFGGPGRSVIQLGASVINLGFGPVAPEVPVEPFELFGASTGPSDGSLPPVGYKRLFDLPAVPTIMVRIEF